MTDRHVPLRHLLDLLPDLTEFDALRETLRKAAIADPALQWSGRSSYSTIDERVIATSSIGMLLMEAESGVRRRLKRLYDAANITFSAATAGGADEKAQQLIALGETAESDDQWRDALAYYLLAHAVTRTSADLKLRALVLRRVGRSAMNVGDFSRAAHYYFISLTVASTAADEHGQVIAATGLGNVAAYQGRWDEADDWHRKALSVCGDTFQRERAQLLMNRAVAAVERKLFDDARALLEQARDGWADLTDADRGLWHNNAGRLLLDQGDLDGAEAAFNQALAIDPAHFDRAMVLDNLAEVAIERGDLDVAEQRCRQAEEEALAHGSPRALARVYLELGRIAARRHDPNGVAFFEKALDITAERQYPLLVGEIFAEYGRFRRELREPGAARWLLEHARDLFIELGAATRVAEMQQELSELPPP